MDLKQYKQKLLKTPKFRAEYEKRDLAREIARLIIQVRVIRGITQEKLAKMIKSKQPSIARLENGNSLPSLSFLNKIAKAFNTNVNLTFEFIKDEYSKNQLTFTKKVDLTPHSLPLQEDDFFLPEQGYLLHSPNTLNTTNKLYASILPN